MTQGEEHSPKFLYGVLLQIPRDLRKLVCKQIYIRQVKN